MQVTRDQSLVNQLIEAGQLTEEEAETFEHNNIILQALGTSDTVQVDLTYAELRRGDTLLLCSDGLSGMVRFDEIREILRSSPEPLDVCKALTERANAAGGHDNITVIVVQFEGEALKPGAAETEPLRYRKYPLPDESAEVTAPHQVVDTPAATHSGHTLPLGHTPPAPAAAAAGGWQERPHDRAGPDGDERIDIPGTHIPWWIVLALVLGVVGLLVVTALILLRG